MSKRAAFIGALVAFALGVVVVAKDLRWDTSSSKAAAPCPDPEESLCTLPDCRCSVRDIPGGLSPLNVPQIVLLTFDGAVTVSNHPIVEDFLQNRINPNGAPITATFFSIHEYSNYSIIHQLYREGHEIGMHSISHTTTTGYWKNLNQTMWEREMVDQKELVEKFALVPIDEIRGMRAPFLQGGGDVMIRALNGNFDWESSRSTFNQRDPGLWPYTYDYASDQDCPIEPCPEESHPGFWTIPMIDLIGDDNAPCAIVDECTPQATTAEEMLDLLIRNFEVQYNGNRAPFGIYSTYGLFYGTEERPEFEERRNGYKQFLDYLGTYPDVYIVTVSQALEWVKNPTPLADIMDFVPWQKKPDVPNGCMFPRNCYYSNSTWERYMSSCVACPLSYPWVHNHLGN